MEGGDLQVATWIKDEGFDTTIPSVMQVLQTNSLYMRMGTSCHLLLQQCSPISDPYLLHKPLQDACRGPLRPVQA